MNIKLHIHDEGLTSIDHDSCDEAQYNVVQFTEWTQRYDEPGERDIAYQVSLYFESVDDVNRVINALSELREKMYCANNV